MEGGLAPPPTLSTPIMGPARTTLPPLGRQGGVTSSAQTLPERWAQNSRPGPARWPAHLSDHPSPPRPRLGLG
eukprot:scaffold78806_cov35-Tisochrysis_lutea.AAC.3